MNTAVECLNLSVSINNKSILTDINLNIQKGESHIIMGPNGAGKSSLLSSIMGIPPYRVANGRISLYQEDITENSIEERAKKGIFISFQNPVAISGVSNIAFLKAMFKAKNGFVDSKDFTAQVKDLCQKVGLHDSFLKRDLNDDFSGGERKRNELLQILLLKPKVVLLDEIDSGLDIDAMKNFASIIQELKSQGITFIIVTHYHSFINLLEIDKVHILLQGSLKESAERCLLDEVLHNGYKKWM